MALVHWWRLDEPNATDVAADSVGGVDLAPDASPPDVVADARFGFVRRWGVGDGNQHFLRAFGEASSSGGNGTLEQSVAGSHPLGIDFNVATEWSLTWWMRITGDISAVSGLFYVGKPDNQVCTHSAPATVHASGHTHAYRIGHLGVDLATTEVPSWRWAHASGSMTSGHNGSNPLPRYGVWLSHALVRRGANVEFWSAGTLLGTFAAANAPYVPQDNFDNPSFAPSPEAFWIGGDMTTNTLNAFDEATRLDMAQVRFYDHALTEAEVMGLAIPEPNAAAPEITLISPANQSTLAGSDTPLVVDVTGSLQYVSLNAAFDGYSLRENVHNSTSFAPNYIDGSTREAITDGYRYSLVRAGGWLTNPALSVDAISTSGNQA